MKTKYLFHSAIAASLVVLMVVFCAAKVRGDESGTAREAEAKPAAKQEYKPKTKAELRRALSRLQYDVTQNEETEPAFHNRYWNNKQKGMYYCICCDRPLFSSDTKFKSGTGWPSFWNPAEKDSVGLRRDFKLFYTRIEVHCKRCGAHLGHVFDDGPPPTGKRYCMNSASLKFLTSEQIKELEEAATATNTEPEKP